MTEYERGYAEGVEAAARFLEALTGPLNSPYQVGKQAAAKIRALPLPSTQTQEAGARDTAPAGTATRPTPDAAPGAPEGGNYCTRCHMTEALHYVPNIYTRRRDTRGNPYPPPCDEFTPAPSPKKDAPRCDVCDSGMRCDRCDGCGREEIDISERGHRPDCTRRCSVHGGTGRSTTGGGR